MTINNKSLKIKFEVMKINVTVNDMMSFKNIIYQHHCNINSTYRYKIKYQAAEGNIYFKKDREINGDSVINFRICSWRRDKTVLVREVKN